MSERKEGKEKRGVEEESGFFQLERLNGFSDAVMAVAITLLILTLEVPKVSDLGDLGAKLRELWPDFLGFLISFLIIGYFWVTHHLMFNYVKRSSPGLLWLNLAFLLFIVVLPFSTDLMSEYTSSKTAMIFYNLNMAFAGLGLLLLWTYISKGNRLLDEDFDPALRKHLLLVYANVAAIFLISVAVAAVSATASPYVYLLLLPNSIFLEWMHRKERGENEPR
ncbi:MAG: DUF1211 domain-containing protein [Actinobacteria bacterium]|nr:DUF1211 domain-containing protein [Actinomycetota bacterium]